MGQAPGTHYYTHTLDKNKARTAGPVSGTESSKIDSNAGTSRTTNVTHNVEESKPQMQTLEQRVRYEADQEYFNTDDGVREDEGMVLPRIKSFSE